MHLAEPGERTMTWVSNNLDLILELTLTHLLLSAIAIALSFVISVPIGWAAHRWRGARAPTLVITGLLYAIPSLPLLIVLPVIFGFSARSPVNIVVALTLYGVALMARQVADGFDSVNRDVVQSAVALGYSSWRRFLTVEFPLAGPVMLAGLRVVAVSTISLLTVGSVIGITSLGLLFTDGLARGIEAEVLTGIVVTVALALVVDALLVIAGRALMPWSVRRTRRGGSAGGALA